MACPGDTAASASPAAAHSHAITLPARSSCPRTHSPGKGSAVVLDSISRPLLLRRLPMQRQGGQVIPRVEFLQLRQAGRRRLLYCCALQVQVRCTKREGCAWEPSSCTQLAGIATPALCAQQQRRPSRGRCISAGPVMGASFTSWGRPQAPGKTGARRWLGRGRKHNQPQLKMPAST